MNVTSAYSIVGKSISLTASSDDGNGMFSNSVWDLCTGAGIRTSVCFLPLQHFFEVRQALLDLDSLRIVDVDAGHDGFQE